MLLCKCLTGVAILHLWWLFGFNFWTQVLKITLMGLKIRHLLGIWLLVRWLTQLKQLSMRLLNLIWLTTKLKPPTNNGTKSQLLLQRTHPQAAQSQKTLNKVGMLMEPMLGAGNAMFNTVISSVHSVDRSTQATLTTILFSRPTVQSRSALAGNNMLPQQLLLQLQLLAALTKLSFLYLTSKIIVEL